VRARRNPIPALLTIALLLAAVILVSGVGATNASAGTTTKSCAFNWRYFVDIGARDTSCNTAERIARRYMAAQSAKHRTYPRHELGFRCQRVNAGNAGGGWYARCRKGRAVVTIVPT
jgi:hypothetical protein